jgi:hypothetical protein
MVFPCIREDYLPEDKHPVRLTVNKSREGKVNSYSTYSTGAWHQMLNNAFANMFISL